MQIRFIRRSTVPQLREAIGVLGRVSEVIHLVRERRHYRRRTLADDDLRFTRIRLQPPASHVLAALITSRNSLACSASFPTNPATCAFNSSAFGDVERKKLLTSSFNLRLAIVGAVAVAERFLGISASTDSYKASHFSDNRCNRKSDSSIESGLDGGLPPAPPRIVRPSRS